MSSPIGLGGPGPLCRPRGDKGRNMGGVASNAAPVETRVPGKRREKVRGWIKSAIPCIPNEELELYENRFVRHGWCDLHAETLSQAQLKEVMPKIGHRAAFVECHQRRGKASKRRRGVDRD